MKLLSSLVLFAVIGAILAKSDCDCDNSPRCKVKVADDCDPKIKVVYTGTPCECQKALPFRVEVPVIPKQKYYKHKYDVQIKEEKPIPICRYLYNTKVEKPVVEKIALSKYPVKVEKLSEECRKDPRYVYSVKVERPEKKCETELDGLVAKMDRIVIPVKDCPQPCCFPNRRCSKENIPKTKKHHESIESHQESSEEHHRCHRKPSFSSEETPCYKKTKHYLQSSEETESASSEETCKQKKPKKCSKVKNCRKCAPISSEENEEYGSASEERENTSEDMSCGCPSAKKSTLKPKPCRCSPSSEECDVQSASSEEYVSKKPKSSGVQPLSSEEASLENRDSSEEIHTCDAPRKSKLNPKTDFCQCDSSEEIVKETSEECDERRPSRKTIQKEENIQDSSEEAYRLPSCEETEGCESGRAKVPYKSQIEYCHVSSEETQTESTEAKCPKVKCCDCASFSENLQSSEECTSSKKTKPQPEWESSEEIIKSCDSVEKTPMKSSEETYEAPHESYEASEEVLQESSEEYTKPCHCDTKGRTCPKHKQSRRSSRVSYVEESNEDAQTIRKKSCETRPNSRSGNKSKGSS